MVDKFGWNSTNSNKKRLQSALEIQIQNNNYIFSSIHEFSILKTKKIEENNLRM
jgi:hypothetical protein